MRTTTMEVAAVSKLTDRSAVIQLGGTAADDPRLDVIRGEWPELYWPPAIGDLVEVSVPRVVNVQRPRGGGG